MYALAYASVRLYALAYASVRLYALAVVGIDVVVVVVVVVVGGGDGGGGGVGVDCVVGASVGVVGGVGVVCVGVFAVTRVDGIPAFRRHSRRRVEGRHCEHILERQIYQNVRICTRSVRLALFLVFEKELAKTSAWSLRSADFASLLTVQKVPRRSAFCPPCTMYVHKTRGSCPHALR